MNWVYLVVGLALLQFFLFGVAVGKARGTYNVPAPATTGNEVFERYFRVQMNTLENLVILVPALLLFATFVNPFWAAGLGAVYLIGRLIYFRAYVKSPQSRSWGFAVSALPNLILLVGGIIGVIVSMARNG